MWRAHGVTTPCARHGWAHAHCTKLHEWRPRLVHDISDDFCLAGQRIYCSACAEEREKLKKHHEGLCAQFGPSSPQAVAKKAEVDACSAKSNTLDPEAAAVA